MFNIRSGLRGVRYHDDQAASTYLPVGKVYQRVNHPRGGDAWRRLGGDLAATSALKPQYVAPAAAHTATISFVDH